MKGQRRCGEENGRERGASSAGEVDREKFEVRVSKEGGRTTRRNPSAKLAKVMVNGN